MAAYSFMDVTSTLVGPGGPVELGYGAAVAEEGITIEPTEDVNQMSIGADGTPMHSLHAGSSGTVRVRLQKTSITNARLNDMMMFQRDGSRNWGQNTLSVRDKQRGDVYKCTDVAFARPTPVTWAKDAGMNEWIFHAGRVTPLLGTGVPASAVNPP